MTSRTIVSHPLSYPFRPKLYHRGGGGGSGGGGAKLIFYTTSNFLSVFQYVVELDDSLLPHPIWIVVIDGAIFFDLLFMYIM